MPRQPWLMEWFRDLFGRERLDAEMDEELRFHLEMEVEKNLRAGLPPAEARRQALIAFGGVERYKEKTREERWGRSLEDLARDVRFASRTLGRTPGFSLIAILSLALGIGANTAIFGVVNAMLFRELPFKDPEGLVSIFRDRAQGDFDPVSYPDFRVIREETEGTFDEVGGFQYGLAHRETESGLETVVVEMVTGNYLPMLGVTATLGRTILPEDHVAPGAHAVLMLGYRYWRNAFGGDPGVVGRSMRLSGRMYTIAGVGQRGFLGSNRGIEADVFASIMMVGELMPLEENPLDSRGSNAFFPVARRRQGTSWGEVTGALEGVSRHLHDVVPEVWQDREELVPVPTRSIVFSPAADRLVIAANILGMTLVGLVLLIACTNLTSFLLAKSVDRRKEIALRMSLGATRGRLLRQMVTETLLLGSFGGAAGFLVGLWLLDLASGLGLPPSMPLGLDLSLDWHVPLFTLALALGAGILIGLVPAIQVTRPDLLPALKPAASSGDSRGPLALSRVLVVGQMAVSVILLVAAGLLFRSFDATRLVDPGFGRDPTALLTFMVPSRDYSDDEGRRLIANVRDEISALPEVTRVGVISNVHLNTVNRMIFEVDVDGVDPPPGRSAHQVHFTSVDEGFFEAAGIGLLEGRRFLPSDRADAPPVAIVNEALARRFWPDRSPLGRTIRIEVPGFPDPTVIGVVETAKIRSLGEPPTPFLYLPYSQEYNAWVSVLAATSGNPRSLARSLYQLVTERHPDLIVTNSTTLGEHIGLMLILRRLSAVASGLFAAVALGLSVMGLYGVVSYSVARRAREMAVRLSLGAEPGSVVALQLARGLRLVALGGILGLPLAWVAGRWMSGLLFGVSASDPFTFLFVPGVLVGVAALAAYVPARRAGRVDPAESLRAE